MDSEGDFPMGRSSPPFENEGSGDDMFPGAHTPPTTGDGPVPVESSNFAAASTSSAQNNSNSVNGGQEQIHKPTGYTWTRDEDAPSFKWKNRKAQEDYARAMEQITDKDRFIGKKYGDVGLDEFTRGSGK